MQCSVLRLDGDDLIPDKFENTVNNGFETLQNLLVRECHVTFLNASLREFGLNTDVDGPLLPVVPEISLDSVLEVHDAFCVYTTSRLRTVGELHLPDFGSEDVTEIAVESRRAAGVAGTSCALGHSEGVLILDLVGDQIDSTTSAIDDEDGIVDLEIQKTRLGAE